MAVSYQKMKCSGCGSSSFTYDKERKVWICQYCQTEIHRKESYDGLYTVKNIVKKVIEDVAYGRFDSAQRNLLECEKIDSNYVGTIIADLTIGVFMLIAGSMSQTEYKTTQNRLKRRLQAFNEISPDISVEEEALYDSFGGSGDVFGTLLITYYMLQANAHFDFVENLLELDSVYSVSLNTQLLGFAMKTGRTDMTDSIFSNVNCIDCHDALFCLLESFEDGDQKRTHMREMFPLAELTPDDSSGFDKYLRETQDSVESKAALYLLAAEKNLHPSVSVLMERILDDGDITEELTESVLGAYCRTHPKDAEVYDLVSHFFLYHSGEQLRREIGILTSSKLFIKLPVKMVQELLNRRELAVPERVGLLDFAEQCRLSDKDNDVLLYHILMNVAEDTDVRLELVNALLKYTKDISIKTMSSYVLDCTLDGERKPEVTQRLLSVELNLSFHRDLLTNYVRQGRDPQPVKQEMIKLLNNSGFQFDADILLDMICSADRKGQTELTDTLRSSIANGVRMKNDALDRYLRRCSPNNWNDGIISLLDTSVSIVSDQSVCRFVLHSGDSEVKAHNAVSLSERNTKPFGSYDCEYTFKGTVIRGNLLQIYLLVFRDSESTAKKLIKSMLDAGAKLGQPVQVGGQTMKYKKLVSMYEDQLSELSHSICDKLGLFSRGIF